ncbi:hypothetical protein GCM10007382_04270 [Salinibacterium xinjiangense]|uniref:Helicase associated domain-containing protein n=1 Tax=Salinibacterium xinjiangense TaxID=386302 RepID=A0A2C8ZLL6_9MICO|nr:hypothetical protein GCM10007382_04270 [Salinibacterium xinjiangense]SOE65785.1 hypothetical protein SAMN06296378_1618 [Salinibacterium xinjiangense]
MSSSTTLTALFEKWRQINDHEPSRWDDSIQLFLAESRPSTEILKIRQGRWISTVHELEAFIERENRWPHANSRRPAEFRSTDEDRLANWVQYQRRSEQTLSDYRADRLELIPGFSWAPLDEKWEQRLWEYVDFVEREGRRPSRRSRDSPERSLSVWRATQSELTRAGGLSAARVELLRSHRI